MRDRPTSATSAYVGVDSRMPRACNAAMNRAGATLFAALAAAPACSRSKNVERTDAAAPPAVSIAASITTGASSARTAPSVRAADATANDRSSDATWSGDAGVASCKTTGGAALQPFVGPALLRLSPSSDTDAIELVYNEAGLPRIFDGRPVDAGARGTPAKSTIPACAAAGDV